jgi:hypothetical protein
VLLVVAERVVLTLLLRLVTETLWAVLQLLGVKVSVLALGVPLLLLRVTVTSAFGWLSRCTSTLACC